MVSKNHTIFDTIKKIFQSKSKSDLNANLPKLGFLISGRGSNLIAILKKIQERKLLANPVLVISNKSTAKGLESARSMGVEAISIKPKDFKDVNAYESELIKNFKDKGVDLIICAGYMKILHQKIIEEYSNKIVNIHPSLLPAFAGLKAQEQAYNYGVKITGCTVHFVDAGMDTGPIIMQKNVNILKTDSLADVTKNILKAEHDTYWRAIKRVLHCNKI